MEEIGGRRLAKNLIKPAIVDFLEFASKTGETSLESLEVKHGAKIANKKVKELRMKEKIGATILVIIRDEKVISNVGPEDEIREGDTVMVIGERESQDKLEELDFF
ncbi:MAG: TrkA C-terminal domain-containing protein [Halobacteriota archaeon]